MAAVSRGLGIVEQTLFNWVKASREGRLSGADGKPVSAEQMEISRLRAELARVSPTGVMEPLRDRRIGRNH
jgi:transposase